MYLKSDTEQEFMNEYKIFLENSSLTYKHLKPSRIQNIINSFIQNNNNAGYIQPIGKHIFLDKFLEKFDVKKFMKRNPNMTSPDFHMVMYNETCGLLQ